MSVLSVLVSPLTLWPCPTVHCLSCLSLTVSLSPSQYLPPTPVPHSHLVLQLGPWISRSRAQGLEDGIRGCLAPCVSLVPVPFLSVSLLSPPGQGPSSLPKSSSTLLGPFQALRPGDGGKGNPQERWSTHGAALMPSIPRASLWSSCVVLPLLALTWMSAVLAVTDRRSALFQILFAVFDSLEGFVIVMVHCILRREVGVLGLGPTCIPRGDLVPSM